MSESRERNATWRERLKREKEGEKREDREVGGLAKITVVIGDTGVSIESSMRPNGPFVVNLSANMLRIKVPLTIFTCAPHGSIHRSARLRFFGGTASQTG